MKYNIIQLMEHHGIKGSTTSSNSTEGWINYKCPYCDDESTHLGLDLKNNFFNCWRCGWHPVVETAAKLTGKSESEVLSLLKMQKQRPFLYVVEEKEEDKKPKFLSLPSLTTDLSPHKKYLRDRGFDPDYLFNKWDLLGTSISSSYAFRIIAPIFFNGQMVSFTARDYTNKSNIRWKTCASEKEVRSLKHCLYGLEKVKGDSIVICEGPSDVWRLGPGAVCTFGTGFSLEQLELLKPFKKRYIYFDEDEAGFKAGAKLAHALNAFKGENYIVAVNGGDPGSLTQKEADEFMKDII